MNLANLVKLNFLIVGFAFTAYLIYSLQNDGLPQSVSNMLGLPGHKTSGQDYVSWCSTRAKTLILPNQTLVYQKGRHWFKKFNKTETPLESLEVERWFSANCRLKVKFIQSNEKTKSSYSNKLGIEFISGVMGYFRAHTAQPDTYEWKGRAFLSPNFSTALKKLENIVHN